MYNLIVADAHTFFVGEGQWLVHNCPAGGQGGNAGKTITDILMPNGQPIGQAGTDPLIREVDGNIDDAMDFFDEMVQATGATPVEDSVFPGL